MPFVSSTYVGTSDVVYIHPVILNRSIHSRLGVYIHTQTHREYTIYSILGMHNSKKNIVYLQWFKSCLLIHEHVSEDCYVCMVS